MSVVETSRIFHICSELVNPNNGETLITEEKVSFVLSRYRTIADWAYILHNRDVYTSEDQLSNPYHKEGTTKPSHFHILIKVSRTTSSETVSKWFGIPVNYIHKVYGGERGITDILVYFTHKENKQRELGKTEYEVDEIKSNFDVKNRILDYLENHDKEWFNYSPFDRILHKVTYEGMTLKEAENTDRFIYMKKREVLKKARLDFLNTRAKLPETRFNFYIYGEGGVGKDFMARALARTLYPDIKNDEDIFFQVGSSNTTFEGYDGQPVIIWNDVRSSTIVETFKERGDIFNSIDIFPKKIRQNIKYGSVCLTNHINIFTGPEEYKSFLEGLINSEISENINQSYRRFPVVIPVKNEEFSILASEWFYHSNGDTNYGHFTEYFTYKRICANIAFISSHLNIEKRDYYTKKALKGIIELYELGIDTIDRIRDMDLAEYERIIEERGYCKELPIEE